VKRVWTGSSVAIADLSKRSGAVHHRRVRHFGASRIATAAPATRPASVLQVAENAARKFRHADFD
jgi:hypothetical protein